MSLFKCREYWSSSSLMGNELDFRCICLCNLDNDADGCDKIIIGTYEGWLRIFNPKPDVGATGDAFGSTSDAWLQTDLGAPVVQVESGRFLGTETQQIAVLHPRKLIIFTVNCLAGHSEAMNQYQLSALYEFKLERCSASMVVGGFGTGSGSGVPAPTRDYICVQSMDGVLSFFENDTLAFSRFLPGFLLPGPLVYVTGADMLVTVSSGRCLESYRYQTLAVAQEGDGKGGKVSGGKRVVSEWSVVLGEEAIDLRVTYYPTAPVSLLVLGERSLFCFGTDGNIRFMKKLDFHPTCFHPYASLTEGTINSVVATHSATLMVYENTILRWSSQLVGMAVGCVVGTFIGLKGGILVVHESGRLEVLYMGTDPSLTTIPRYETARDMNIAEFDKSMAKVKAEIHDCNTDLLPKSMESEHLALEVDVPTTRDKVSQAGDDSEIRESDPIPSVTATVRLRSRSGQTGEVTLTVDCSPPLVAGKSVFRISSTGSFDKPTEIPVSFYMKYNYSASDLSVGLMATYTVGSLVQVTKSSFQLPLLLVCRPTLPLKSDLHKLTVDSDRELVKLHEIFPEFAGSPPEACAQAMGFQLIGSPAKITLLASNKSNRYRLQSGHFEAMWLILRELIERLGARKKPPSLTYKETLPLQEVSLLVEQHLSLRHNVLELAEILGQRATQYRVIQKRLLTKFKDKTPTPLQNLDVLLEGTYKSILKAADAVNSNRVSLIQAGAHLSCAVNLLVTLLGLTAGLTAEELAVLRVCLPTNILDYDQYGWEEVATSAITLLLSTSLSKSASDSAAVIPPLELPKDADKLCKLLVVLCDRVAKGGRPRMEGVVVANRTPAADPTAVDPIDAVVASEPPRLPDYTVSGVGERDSSRFVKKPPSVEAVRDGGLGAVSKSREQLDGIPDLDDMEALIGEKEDYRSMSPTGLDV